MENQNSNKTSDLYDYVFEAANEDLQKKMILCDLTRFMKNW